MSFVEERERVIREQQESIRELSTPVLQVRDRLLILPIIGVLDSPRARQLTEQLLGAIQANRAKVVVIDITGVATIDVTVANHLVQTVEAARLMGASAIITGLSSKIAQTLVDLGVDLSMMRTVGDLQGGLEEAERLLGYRPGRAGRTSRTTEVTRRHGRRVAILRQGDYLIASIQSDLTDSRGARAARRPRRARRPLRAPRAHRRRRRARRHRLLRRPLAALDRRRPRACAAPPPSSSASSPTSRSPWCSSTSTSQPLRAALDLDEALGRSTTRRRRSRG